MEDKIKIIEGALGSDPDLGTYVTVPFSHAEEIKGKLSVVVDPMIITDRFEKWIATEDELRSRKIVLRHSPNYSMGKEPWLQSDIEKFVMEKNPIAVDPVSGVFEPVRSILEAAIDFHDPSDSTLLTLWIMGSFVQPVFDTYPYISLLGTRGSGKTKVLEIISRLGFNAEMTSNATPSSIFRIIEANGSTILIDEGEMLSSREDSSELRLILNAGYKRNNPVRRTNKDTHKVETFNVFSPKMIAAINPLDPTLRTRCIQVTMVRTGDTSKGNVRINDSYADWNGMRAMLYRYGLRYMKEIQDVVQHDADISLLECRQNELWLPLLAIAKHLKNHGSQDVFDTIGARALRDNDTQEPLDDWHKAVLLALDLVVTSEKEYPVREIRGAAIGFLEDMDDAERMKHRWVGFALARFGLKRGTRKAQGYTYVVSRSEVADLMRRYQMEGMDEHREHSE